MNPVNRTSFTVIAAAAAATLMLSACNRAEDTTVGQRVDETVASTERGLDNAGDRMREGMGQAREALADTGITTKVKAELARDPELSAIDVSVETDAGRVVLTGEAPNVDARERATRLASAVDGVRDVDNQLALAIRTN